MSKRAVLLFSVLALWSAPSRAEIGFKPIYDELLVAMTKACSGRSDCLRSATSFGWFLWNNRDKTDIGYNTAKCVGISAVKRGYIWSPFDMMSNMSPIEAQDVGVEVCDCVIGYWGREPVCRQALIYGQTQMLVAMDQEP